MVKPIKGVWMWPEEIVRFGGECTMERLARAGFTDVYFLTKGQAGSVCYTGSAVALKAAYPGRDILEEAISAAHRHGLRLHCWFTSSNDAAYKALYPEEGLAHFKRGRDNSVITLCSEKYMDYMRRVIREVFDRYNADGLHLDYIRYGNINLGWGDEDMASLEALGADLAHLRRLMAQTAFGTEQATGAIFDAYTAGDADVHLLARYRRENVRRFAECMIGGARSMRQDVTVSAALMPEGAYVGDEKTKGVSGVAFAALHYGQSYEDAARLYDYSAIMSYAPAFGKTGEWSSHLCENAMNVYHCRVLGGIQAYGEATSRTLGQDRAEMRGLAENKSYLGDIFFRSGAFCLAFPAGNNQVRLENTLEEIITRVEIGEGGAVYPVRLMAGGSAVFPIDAPDALIRVFCGETESSVLLCKA